MVTENVSIRNIGIERLENGKTTYLEAALYLTRACPSHFFSITVPMRSRQNNHFKQSTSSGVDHSAETIWCAFATFS
jgi:hypothetical protein